MNLKIKEILEGWKNLIHPSEDLKELIEEVSRERMTICNTCPHMSINAKQNGYKTFRLDDHCTKCGCPLAAKTRSLSSACPIGTWKELTDDATRYEIEKQLNDK